MVYINEEKLKTFDFSNDNFCVVIDFDRTITTGDSLGSWSILENPNFMNSDFQKASSKLIEKYYPIELDYSLDDKTKFMYMQEWYSKNMDLFYFYGLTYDILLDCVKHADTKFRGGFKNFLNMLFDKNIPVIILSAGIGNVIVELLKLNNCLYDNIHIVSNFIKFENNKMLPFDAEMIHTSNKSIDRLPIEIRNKITDKDYILLFGDLIEDLNMISKKDNAITVGFLENDTHQNFDVYKANFDVVLTGDDAKF